MPLATGALIPLAVDLLIGLATGSDAGGASKGLFDALKQRVGRTRHAGANAKELAATLRGRLHALRQQEFAGVPDNEVEAVEHRIAEFLRLHLPDAPFADGLSSADLQRRLLSEQPRPWRDINESLGQRMLAIVCDWLIETAADQKDFLRKSVQDIIARQRKADERATNQHAETTAQNQAILTAIRQVQDDPGLKWARDQAQLALDHAPAATDQAAVTDPLAIAMHAEARRAARDLARANPSAGNAAPTDPFWQAANRLAYAVDRPLRELPETVTDAWIATLLLGNEWETDNGARPPDQRKLLADALNFTSTLLSFFPTARQLHARAQVMRPRPDLQEPATAALDASMGADFVPRKDGETVRALLDAGQLGQPNADEARVVAEATTLNFALAMAQLKTILSRTAQTPEDVETLRRIDAVQRSAEPALRALAAQIPPDQRHTILSQLDALGKAEITNPNETVQATGTVSSPPESTTPPPDFSNQAAEDLIRAGEAPPPSWRPFITQLGFGHFGWTEEGILDTRNERKDFAPQIDLRLLTLLPGLQRLALDGMHVTDLSPLAGLPALQHLDLDGTKVTDLSPLAFLPALQRLDLDGTPVTDLSPLAGLPALRELYLTGTKVTDISRRAFIAERKRRGLPQAERD